MPKDMSVDDMVKWINQLYKDNNIHAFYIWKTWIHLRDDALKDQHNECQVCKASKGLAVQATVGHHIKPLRKFPWLALSKPNIQALCEECHYEIHHGKKNKWNDERW